MTDGRFIEQMRRMGAVDREPRVPKGRIRTWEIEWDGEIYKVVEMRVYESCADALLSASVVAGVLFVALVGILLWK